MSKSAGSTTIRIPRWIFVALMASWALLFASVIDQSLYAEEAPDRPNKRGAEQRLDSRTSDADAERPRFAFVDAARKLGLPVELTPTWGSAWADVNRDGAPELLVNRHKRRAWYGSLSDGRFRTTGAGEMLQLPSGRQYYDRHSCAWGEANGDGVPDMYCASGAQRGVGEGPNQLLLGPSLVDAAESNGVVDLLGRGRTVNWLDHDSDGDLDLFVGNEVRSGHPSLLYRNEGGRFEAVASPVAGSYATTDSSWADYDRDGDPDLLILGHGERGAVAYVNAAGNFVETLLPGISGGDWLSGAWGDVDGDGWVDLHLVAEDRAVLFRNNGGELRPKQRVALKAGRSSAWLDVDNDGYLDLYIVQGAPRGGSLAETNLPDLLLVREGAEWRSIANGYVEGYDIGSGDSVSVADFDRDGRQDLLVTNGYLDKRGPVSLLRNVSEAGNSAGLTIIGDDMNPFGYGARLRVTTSQGSYWRYLTDGMAFHAQSEVGYQHLGLGIATTGRVKVMWPDGSTDCYAIESGERSLARKGTSTCL